MSGNEQSGWGLSGLFALWALLLLPAAEIRAADLGQLVEKIKQETAEKADKLEELRSLLRNPDPDVRVAAFQAMVDSGDPVVADLALEIGLSSADSLLRGLALRAALSRTDTIILELSLPDGSADDVQDGYKRLGGAVDFKVKSVDPVTGKFTLRGGSSNGTGQVAGTLLQGSWWYLKLSLELTAELTLEGPVYYHKAKDPMHGRIRLR